MSRAVLLLLIITATATVLTCPGCGNIEGPDLPYLASPRVIVGTPESPAEGDVALTFQLIDRELEPGDITLQYSTDGGQTFINATLVDPAAAANLASAWHPGKIHSVTWDSLSDNIALSGDVTLQVKVTPSDASNPSGTAGVSDTFTVNNTAYNQSPTATVATPAGVQSGNIQINYFLADAESNTCSIAVLYSTNGGTTHQAATMALAGDGVSNLSSSPSGTAHVYLWDSGADNVALSGQLDTVRIRITPTDFNAGTAGETNSFSVDNSVANNPPTVAITGGPADGSTVPATQVTFTWSGSDTDGTVTGYYYSFDQDPPDVWTTGTSVTSGALSEAAHTFRVVAMDDDSDLSTVASRTFTISVPGTITAEFSASTTSGTAPLTVDFSDLSTATNGIDTWSWDFGNGDTSTAQHPDCIYTDPGTFTVSLTVTGPDGSDTEAKIDYMVVSASGTVVPPLGGSSGGSGGGYDIGGAEFMVGDVTYSLIVPSTPLNPAPFLIIYSGTEGRSAMTTNMLNLRTLVVGLEEFIMTVLDGPTSSAADGALVFDDIRSKYNIDNDKTCLLSESSGTAAGLELGFNLRQSYFAAFWPNDVNASGIPQKTSLQLGFAPWGNAGPGGNWTDANAIVDGMQTAGYRLPPDAPYDGPGSGTHGDMDQFIAALEFFPGKSRQ